MVEFIGAVVLTIICWYPTVALVAILFMSVAFAGWGSLLGDTRRETFWMLTHFGIWLVVAVLALYFWWEVVASRIHFSVGMN